MAHRTKLLTGTVKKASDSYRVHGVATALRLAVGWGPFVLPGCLTSEYEERETWTAESLRAASSYGEIRAESGFGRDFGGLTFQGPSLVVCFLGFGPGAADQWLDLVKRCD